MNIEKLLNQIETFDHKSCNNCQLAVEGTSFGKSCLQHHIDWRKDYEVDWFQIWQDPGGSTPEHTENLCGICNSLNPSDKSAQNSFDLIKAAIIGDWHYERNQVNQYLKRWYITNSIKHAIPTTRVVEINTNNASVPLENPNHPCTQVLKEEINLIKPKIITPFGKRAIECLQTIGKFSIGNKSNAKFISIKDWVEQSPLTYYVNGTRYIAFCLYLTSAKVTNQTLSKLYNDNTMKQILKLKETHPNPEAVEQYLEKYNEKNNSGKYTTRDGMYYHLWHWMRLGEIIRSI